MEAAGIEPVSEESQLVSEQRVSDGGPLGAANALHDSGTDWLDLSRVDSELRKLIEAWPLLPEHIKAAFGALAAGVRPTE